MIKKNLQKIAISFTRAAPKNADAWYYVGLSHLEVDENEDNDDSENSWPNADGAIEMFLKALECDPDHIESMLQLAQIHHENKSHEDAKKYAKKALKTMMKQGADESESTAQRIYGLALHEERRYAEAKPYLINSLLIELDPEALIALAEILVREGFDPIDTTKLCIAGCHMYRDYYNSDYKQGKRLMSEIFDESDLTKIPRIPEEEVSRILKKVNRGSVC